MQHGGVYVVDFGGALAVEGLVAPLVALAMGDTALDTASGEPVGKDERVVVTSFACLRTGHASEFGCPVDDGVLQQAALLQVLNQSRCASRHAEGEGRVVTGHVLVTIPVAAWKAIVVTAPDLDETHAPFDQPAGDEALPAEILGFFLGIDVLRVLRLWVVEAVHLEDVLWFFRDVQCPRGGQLKPGSQFVAAYAGIETRITGATFSMSLVQLIDQIDAFPVTGLGDVVGMGMKILDGVLALRKDGSPLGVSGQKRGSPVLRSVGSEASMVRQNHEGGQVLVFGAQAHSLPKTQLPENRVIENQWLANRSPDCGPRFCLSCCERKPYRRPLHQEEPRCRS